MRQSATVPHDDTATRLLHRLTCYSPDRDWTDPGTDERVVRELQVNDLDRWPYQYKRYDDGLPRLALPRQLPLTTAPALEVLAGTAHPPATTLDLPQLARLLYLSSGVVRTGQRSHDRTILFRAAGSAGARFPLEIYALIPDGTALPAGVYWYDPEQHELVLIGPAPLGIAAALVLTGVPWRTGWRYRERGYRHLYWDGGTMLAQLLAAADSAGLTAELYPGFPDAAVAAVIGSDGVHEFPLAVVALGSGQPSFEPTGPAATGRVDAAPVEFPLVTAAQRAGEQTGWGEPWTRGRPVPTSTEVATDGQASIEQVVLRRGSQRRMDPSRGVSRELLESSMAAALRGIDVPHWIVVHEVTGLTPGVYRWPQLDVPAVSTVGPLRERLYEVCLEQGLGRDAAFVVIGAIDLATVDDHGYREAQLAAGLVEGRLHLMAYAQWASATGMTFLDSEIAGLLGQDVQGLLFTCVGVPEYASTAGGQPGAPVPVSTMQPR